MNNTYNVGQVAELTGIPKLGRNKLYRILKDLGFVDRLNRPDSMYVEKGIFVQPVVEYKPGWFFKYNVTLIVGNKGIRFVLNQVMKYLEQHPMPTFPHHSKCALAYI